MIYSAKCDNEIQHPHTFSMGVRRMRGDSSWQSRKRSKRYECCCLLTLSIDTRRNSHARTSFGIEYVCVSGETPTTTVIGARK